MIITWLGEKGERETSAKIMEADAKDIALDLLEKDGGDLEDLVDGNDVNGHVKEVGEELIDDQSESVLDWSVSAISCATGMNAPDRFYTDPSSASASAWSSPEKVNRVKSGIHGKEIEDQSNIQKTYHATTVLKIKDDDDVPKAKPDTTALDIKQLVDNIQNLRSSIGAIHQKSLTPLNSPRRKQNTKELTDSEKLNLLEDELGENSSYTTPKAKGYSHYGEAFNSTPPVKDTGFEGHGEPIKSHLLDGQRSSSSHQTDNKSHLRNDKKTASNSSNQMSQMQMVLKDLENARKRYLDNSKLAKRNLSFNEDKTRKKLQPDMLTEESTESSSTPTEPSSVPEPPIHDVSNDDNKRPKPIPGTMVNIPGLSDNLPHSPLISLQNDLPKTAILDSKRLLDREFEEMNLFLDQVKNSSPSFTANVSSPLALTEHVLSMENNTARNVFPDLSLTKTDDDELKKSQRESLIGDLRIKLEKENLLNIDLEETVVGLKKQIHDQDNQIIVLETANNEKLQLLVEVKQRWSEVSKQWTQGQQELSERLKESNKEITQLKAESEGAKGQFSICQKELQKALKIASDFKIKLEEEEKIKNDMLNELLSQKTAKAKHLQVEQRKYEDLKNENQELSLRITQLENENQILIKNQSDAVLISSNELLKAKEGMKKVTLENEKLKEEVSDLAHEKQSMEASLHSFYASQMESILTEKVSTLQSNVKAWETNMMREKQEAIEFLQNQHVIQMESLNERHLKDMERNRNSMKVFKASLAASRKEADALREQLGLERDRSELKKGETFLDVTTPLVSSYGATAVLTSTQFMSSMNARNDILPGMDNVRSMPRNYNFSGNQNLPCLPRASPDGGETIKRGEKLWSKLLTSSLKDELPSRVQNNLSHASNSKSVVQVNGHRLLDVITSSTSEDNSRSFQNYSRRSIRTASEHAVERNQRRASTFRHKQQALNRGREDVKALYKGTADVVDDPMQRPMMNPVPKLEHPTKDESSRAMKSKRATKEEGDPNMNNAVTNSSGQTFIEKTSANNHGETMTVQDKEAIVQNLVETFFKNHPEQILDPQLLFELNTMAQRLVEKSPDPLEEMESILVPELEHTTNNSSLYEMKKMLAERLSTSMMSQQANQFEGDGGKKAASELSLNHKSLESREINKCTSPPSRRRDRPFGIHERPSTENVYSSDS